MGVRRASMCPSPQPQNVKRRVSSSTPPLKEVARPPPALPPQAKFPDAPSDRVLRRRAPLVPVSLNASSDFHRSSEPPAPRSTAYGSFSGEVLEAEATVPDARPLLQLGRAETLQTQYGPITVLVPHRPVSCYAHVLGPRMPERRVVR
jgi:hypothetical protein